MKRDAQIRPVFSHTFYHDIIRLIQTVYNLLLDRLIQFVIQRIDPDDFVKNLLIVFSHFRRRESNDRKTSFLSFDIFVYDTSRL